MPEESIDHDAMTQVGPTELGVVVSTGPQLAYSDETEVLDYPEPASHARVGLIAGGIVVAAAVAVGAVLWAGRAGHDSPAPVAAPSSTTTTVAPPPPPPPITTVIVQPPSTVTQTPSTPTPAAPQWVSIYDQQLFNKLTGQGINIPDYGLMARDAHLVCARLANGRTVAAVKDEYAQASGGNYVIAQLFVMDVMSIYPSCP